MADQNALNHAIEEGVRRLVDFYKPERIYLFSSAARGGAGPDSDLGFLVVVPDDCPREVRFSGEIYRRLWNVPMAVDVVPWSRSDFEGRQCVQASLPATVVREGKLVYDAEAVSV